MSPGLPGHLSLLKFHGAPGAGVSSREIQLPQVDTSYRVHASSAQTPSPVGHHDTVQSLQGPLSAGVTRGGGSTAGPGLT